MFSTARFVRAPFRLALVPWLAAFALLTGACAQQDLPPWATRIPPAPDGPAPVDRPPEPLPEVPAEDRVPRELPRVEDTITLAPTEEPPELVRVAILLPLSGPSAPLGEALLNAAQMALFDVADERFVLQPYDTAGGPEEAAEAAALALQHGVRLIIGPVFASAVSAVSPQARAGGVNVIAFSTDTTVAEPGVFVAGFLLRDQVRRVMTHEAAQGVGAFAALAPSSDAGRVVVESMRGAAADLGVSLTQVEFYDPGVDDHSRVVRRLAHFDTRKAELERRKRELRGREDEASRQALRRLERLETIGDVPYEALMLPEEGTRLRALAALLPFYDIDTSRVRVLGTMRWGQEQGLGREPALVGARFAMPPAELHETFAARYGDLYGAAPPRIASLAYDITALAAVLAQNENGPDFSRETLTSGSGFVGIDGIFRLLPDGTSERGFAVMEVTPEGLRRIDPAPVTFQRLLN